MKMKGSRDELHMKRQQNRLALSLSLKDQKEREVGKFEGDRVRDREKVPFPELLPSLTTEQQALEDWEDELINFEMYRIETDPSIDYGDGFRTAMICYLEMGLSSLLGHLQ